jgi:16S rRNA processing protein RimM
VSVAPEEVVTVGRIERPFGVKGAMKVRSLSDVPGRLEQLTEVRVAVGGRTTDRTVTHVRKAGASYIVQFAGISTPEEAALLRGGLIQIPRQSLPTLSRDIYYECDLIGITVCDQAGRELGCVDTMWELPGHHVFVVKRGEQELLIPAAKNFVLSVDVPGRKMIVRGVEDLNEERHAV